MDNHEINSGLEQKEVDHAYGSARQLEAGQASTIRHSAKPPLMHSPEGSRPGGNGPARPNDRQRTCSPWSDWVTLSKNQNDNHDDD